MRNPIILLKEIFKTKETYETKMRNLSIRAYDKDVYKTYLETLSDKELVVKIEIAHTSSEIKKEVTGFLMEIRDEIYNQTNSPIQNQEKIGYLIGKLTELSFIVENILKFLPSYGELNLTPKDIKETFFFNEDLIETVKIDTRTYSEQKEQILTFANTFVNNLDAINKDNKAFFEKISINDYRILTLYDAILRIKNIASSIISDNELLFDSEKYVIKFENHIPIPFISKDSIKEEKFIIEDEIKEILISGLKGFVYQPDWSSLEELINTGKTPAKITFIGNQNQLPELLKRIRYNKGCKGSNNALTYFIVNNWFYQRQTSEERKEFFDTTVSNVICKTDKEPSTQSRILKKEFPYKIKENRS
jgi:hypothetical protein